MKNVNHIEIKKVIINILNQCYQLDQLKVNKEEMHNPWKHIIVTKKNKPVLLDFERCYETKKPHNLTQFCTFLMVHKILDRDKIIPVLKVYKNSLAEKDFKKIITQI
jgi:predicted Ser/Thr protein kinase